MKVLLIDDEDVMHGVIDSYLEKFGRDREIELHTRSLHDPVQGLLEATINGDSYDLIMLDVRLPKLGGDDIYASLLRNKPNLADRVLFITCYGRELRNRFVGRELQILGKPFLYESFESTIDSMLH